MKELSGKTVLVTGAASGIGRATARAFADRGCQLIVCDVDQAGLDEVARALGPALLHAQRVDVSKRDEMAAFADEVHRRVAAVDVLVNNAGVGLSGGVSDTTLDDWQWVLGVNLWGVIHGVHYFVPPMRRRGAGGHVVNLSSLLGLLAGPKTIGYSTTKFAVFGLSESLRGELAPEGIGVSTICPGMIATNIVRTGRFAGVADEHAAQEQADAMFHKRGFGPEKVARAIVDAVRHDRAVVPVAPEAWAAWLLRRFAPGLGERISRLAAKRTP